MGLKRLLFAGALMLGACQQQQTRYHNPNPAENGYTKEAIEAEREIYREFMRISEDYIEYRHDCDDMSQEFRDVLVGKGALTNDIRLAYAKNKENHDGHMWLERKDAGVWLAYDASNRLYAVSPDTLRETYNVEKYFKGDEVYREPMFSGLPIISFKTGYFFRNDKFVNGKWVRAK